MDTKDKKPQCVAMIMDGNRRWAKEQGRTSLEGHYRGYEKLKEVVEWMKDVEIPNLIVYAFSTENWNRSKEEVSYLMDLFRKVLTEEVKELHEKNVRVIFAGDVSRFPQDIQVLIEETHKRTKGNTEFTLVIAASYGGRTEILHAVNRIMLDETRKGAHAITEEEFAKYLWTKDVPDPDIIIRTSGEQRLSNFLPWQSVYSELFFTKTYWPAFSKEEFLTILDTFARRQRRMGA